MPMANQTTSGIKAFYTGRLTYDLVPESKYAVVTFEERNGAWTYWGPVHDGLLDGSGPFSYQATNGPPCEDRVLDTVGQCSSTCLPAEFAKGHLVRAKCDLVLQSAAWREKKNWFGVQERGFYSGNVSEAKGSSQPGGTSLGPLPITFDGQGKLLSGKTLLIGDWRDGALQGSGSQHSESGEIRIGNFEDGMLKSGQVYGKPFPYTQTSKSSVPDTLSYDVNEFAPTGTVVRLGAQGFAFGRMQGSNPRGPFLPGFEGIRTTGGFDLNRFDEEHRSGETFHPTIQSANADCHYHEDFGQNSSGWFKRG
jgi:hypothetical protein